MKYILPFLVLLLWSCGGKEKVAETEEIIRPVRYAQIGSSHVHGDVTFSGVALAEKESSLSFKVGGNVRSLNVKVGDKVRKGQLLATVDASDYAIQADQAKASTKGAEAQVKTALTQMQIAKSTYERIERLYENGSVSVSEFDQAKSQYEAAKSQHEAAVTQVTSANKQVQAASNQVNYTRLYAPYAGIITEKMSELNELVGAGSPIFKLSSLGKPKVEVGMPENYIGRVKRGQKVDVKVSVVSDEKITGVVNEISFATQGGSTYPVHVRLTGDVAGIRPGMAATVWFDFEDEHVDHDADMIMAPMNAVGEDPNGNYVFVLKPANGDVYTAERRIVQVGGMSSNGFEIKSGLQPGEKIATAGLSTLLDGMKVKLLK